MISSVHPHVHGERSSIDAGDPERTGSSPRAWGTRPYRDEKREGQRFIPTCMGNAYSSVFLKDVGPVHPHVHGERVDPTLSKQVEFGSSPRAWGTQRVRENAHRRRRFIPTCMGNARTPGQACPTMTVHPHVHGERSSAALPSRASAGSSPRAWGTQPGREDRGPAARFIPTCMGNAPPRTAVSLVEAVHPHVHGERTIAFWHAFSLSGSSPRAWGTREIAAQCGLHDRFIPTCMGNALTWAGPWSHLTVHPHVHGERCERGNRAGGSSGSSPRAWGTQRNKLIVGA